MNSEQSKPDVPGNKSYHLAIRIVRLAKHLREEKKEYVLSKQILRSGTAIGALIKEAAYAQSKADFINKMSVALKEAHETEYCLNLLKETDYLNPELFESLQEDC